MDFCCVGLNIDGSLVLQKQLGTALDVMVDLEMQENNLRLWANATGLRTLFQTIEALRAVYTEKPWLTFLGSGDLHHVTLALLRTLPVKYRPITLVILDNHPDWFVESPTYHCTNWVSGALKLPWVQQVVLVGQDSRDLSGWCFRTAPISALCAGRIIIYPYARKTTLVPMQWLPTVAGVSKSKKCIYGTQLQYQTLQLLGIGKFFHQLGTTLLAGQNVYISIDKDCLNTAAAATDWEQGQMELGNLVAGIQMLQKTCRVVGVDICGERAPGALRGIAKCLDAHRWPIMPVLTPPVLRCNEATNMALLHAFAQIPVIA